MTNICRCGNGIDEDKIRCAVCVRKDNQPSPAIEPIVYLVKYMLDGRPVEHTVFSLSEATDIENATYEPLYPAQALIGKDKEIRELNESISRQLDTMASYKDQEINELQTKLDEAVTRLENLRFDLYQRGQLYTSYGIGDKGELFSFLREKIEGIDNFLSTLEKPQEGNSDER